MCDYSTALLIILLILLFRQSCCYEKQINDKIQYYNKVIRATHSESMYPHVTLLFRMKIG